jgi:NADH-ubiquinone oxidoreductase chain 3
MRSLTFFLLFIPILAGILLIINLILAPHNPYGEKKTAFECGFHSFLDQNRTQFNISFFIFALLFLLFDLEILLVYPYAVSSYINNIYGLIVMLLFLIFLTLGFVFELGKNALSIYSRQYNNNMIQNSKIIKYAYLNPIHYIVNIIGNSIILLYFILQLNVIALTYFLRLIFNINMSDLSTYYNDIFIIVSIIIVSKFIVIWLGKYFLDYKDSYLLIWLKMSFITFLVQNIVIILKYIIMYYDTLYLNFLYLIVVYLEMIFLTLGSSISLPYINKSPIISYIRYDPAYDFDPNSPYLRYRSYKYITGDPDFRRPSINLGRAIHKILLGWKLHIPEQNPYLERVMEEGIKVQIKYGSSVEDAHRYVYGIGKEIAKIIREDRRLTYRYLRPDGSIAWDKIATTDGSIFMHHLKIRL